MKPNPKLVQLYQQMADMTAPECASVCRVPHSCCSPEYCETALQIAKEDYGIDLPMTDHPTLKLMGPTGCTAPPYLRPDCALYCCSINSVGFRTDPVKRAPDMKWTNRYFRLRAKIWKETALTK